MFIEVESAKNARVVKRFQDPELLKRRPPHSGHGTYKSLMNCISTRSLPNPYWESALRPLTGRDPPVVRFLEAQPGVLEYIDDIVKFMTARIPAYHASSRQYLTVAVGCTGGQHRSVYIVERLAERFAHMQPAVRVRHAALPLAG